MQDMVFFISEHLILSSIWFFFLIIVILLTVKNLFLNFKFINTSEAIQLINQKNASIIDTRSLESFKEGHIINSINLPLKNLCLKNIQKINLQKFSPVILIFNGIQEYNKYIKEFVQYGCNRIFVLKNGIHDWNSDHLPLVSQEK